MRKFPIVALAFNQSLASGMLGRGVFFITANRFGFGDAAQLWISLGCGLAYVVGALISQRCARAWGSRKHLESVAVALGLLAAAAALWPVPVVVVPVIILCGAVFGTFWPILESFVAGGECSTGMIRSISRFNLAWAIALPLSLSLSGALAEWNTAAIFVAGVLAEISAWAWIRRLPSEPNEYGSEHMEPLSEAPAEWGRLLRGHRLLMVAAYLSAFTVQPLLPRILSDLQVPVRWAGFWASQLDWMRVVIFWAGGVWAGWHGRRNVVLFVALAVPVGYGMILAGAESFAMVILGQIIFGFGMGGAYYGALYYGLALHRGSAAAGGAHEALIGTAFSLGPLLGLMGLWILPASNGRSIGLLAMILPVLVFCSAISWVQSRGARR
ncbi:MAG: hypothetical protein KBA51_00810 [Kiritimatiellae bacterium]|nr:hypothetical protein [Kiritimatiellia bacterium]